MSFQFLSFPSAGFSKIRNSFRGMILALMEAEKIVAQRSLA